MCGRCRIYVETVGAFMEITDFVYEKLISMPDVPPESGGIIGGKKDIIDTVVFDSGYRVDGNGTYCPNITFLNQMVNKWVENGIAFYGMFHSHAIMWNCLSREDRIYITQIMQAMPKEIGTLLFPLVFPKKEIKFYCAKRLSNNVEIDEIDVGIKIQ